MDERANLIDTLIERVSAREPLGGDAEPEMFAHQLSEPGEVMYSNTLERLGIDFTVERLAFPGAECIDPRVVRIPPGKNNERHRHGHESLFIVLEGEGEVLVGASWIPLRPGGVAFVPRWVFHQTRNTSAERELVILAITDFGFASAILGDYDRSQRLRSNGVDAEACGVGVDSERGEDMSDGAEQDRGTPE